MRKIDNYHRVKRLIESAISDFSLDLKGISVLTEAASGSFVVTPLIAALSGAEKVIAITKDSNYGLVSEVKEFTEELAKKLGVVQKIKVTDVPAYKHAKDVELVTNLGFVRPIDERLVNLLPDNAAITLMYETWEFRKEDVDIIACRKRGIPVLGTCETHERLQIFRYVGLVVLRLLLEASIELFGSNVLLIGSGCFGRETKYVLQSNGCNLHYIDPCEKWDNNSLSIKLFLERADAVVLVEHIVKFSLLGGETGLPLKWLEDTGVLIFHICGNVDYEGLESRGINKIPMRKVDPGYMTVTTDYVGPKPVIDLHTAGLKIGEAMVKGMRRFSNPEKAIEFALKNSPAMKFQK